jgi:membrane-associated phospholipid phosphatase
VRRPSESLYLYAVFSLLAGLALTQHQLTVGRAWGTGDLCILLAALIAISQVFLIR